MQCDQNQPCRQSDWKSLQERDGGVALHYYRLVASERDRAWGRIAHLDISHKRGALFTVLIRVSFPHVTRKGWEGVPVLIFQASPVLS